VRAIKKLTAFVRNAALSLLYIIQIVVYFIIFHATNFTQKY